MMAGNAGGQRRRLRLPSAARLQRHRFLLVYGSINLHPFLLYNLYRSTNLVEPLMSR